MDLRFIVFWIALRQLLHGPGVGLGTGKVAQFIVVDVDYRERVDIVALALRLGADALPLGDGRGAVGEILRRRRDVRVP